MKRERKRNIDNNYTLALLIIIRWENGNDSDNDDVAADDDINKRKINNESNSNNRTNRHSNSNNGIICNPSGSRNDKTDSVTIVKAGAATSAMETFRILHHVNATLCIFCTICYIHIVLPKIVNWALTYTACMYFVFHGVAPSWALQGNGTLGDSSAL